MTEKLTLPVSSILFELIQKAHVKRGQIVVFGVSTSEVSGHPIGTAGTEEVAEQIYMGIEAVREETGFQSAFQCCQHLNRALVVERSLLEQFQLDEVAAVPIPQAGGAMASYAYRRMKDPCLAERIQAHAGIDIGDTFIGMHLKPVAVPVRPSIIQLGQAHVTMAFSRPKLIGGGRALYAAEETGSNLCF